MLKHRACAFALLTVTCAVSASAQATPPESKVAPAAEASRVSRAQQLAAAQKQLETDDLAAIEQAITRLAELGGDGPARLIAERLRRGLSPQLAEVAIDALVTLHDVRTAPVLLELTLHRRWQLRVKAITALAALRAQSTQSALLYALNDPSAEVRGAAVAALDQVGDARALPALLAAFDKQVDGSAQALGKLAGPREVDPLLSRAVAGDVTRLQPALVGILTRERFPLAAKLKLISALAALASPSALDCLSAAQAAQPGRVEPRLEGALAAALGTKPTLAMQPPAGPTVLANKGAVP